jgi:hypothetical protein
MIKISKNLQEKFLKNNLDWIERHDAAESDGTRKAGYHHHKECGELPKVQT